MRRKPPMGMIEGTFAVLLENLRMSETPVLHCDRRNMHQPVV
ncbi:hypothetical protein [Haloferula sp.]